MATGLAIGLTNLPGAAYPVDGRQFALSLLLLAPIGFGLARTGHARIAGVGASVLLLAASFSITFDDHRGGGHALWEAAAARDQNWQADREHLVTFILEPRLGELHVNDDETRCALRVSDRLFLTADVDSGLSVLSVDPESFELRFDTEGGHRCEDDPAT